MWGRCAGKAGRVWGWCEAGEEGEEWGGHGEKVGGQGTRIGRGVMHGWKRTLTRTLIKTEYWDRAGGGGHISYDW